MGQRLKRNMRKYKSHKGAACRFYTNSPYVAIDLLRHVRLFATPWTIAHQTPLSMGFSRQEYWGGLPCPPPGARPDLGTEPVSPA